MSGVNAMPTSPIGLQSGANAHGASTYLWDVGPLQKGVGNSNNVMTARLVA